MTTAHSQHTQPLVNELHHRLSQPFPVIRKLFLESIRAPQVVLLPKRPVKIVYSRHSPVNVETNLSTTAPNPQSPTLKVTVDWIYVHRTVVHWAGSSCSRFVSPTGFNQSSRNRAIFSGPLKVRKHQVSAKASRQNEPSAKRSKTPAMSPRSKEE